MQALVEHKGKQFLVEENSEFKFPYLGGEVGEKIELEKILYTDDSKKKEFGSPYVDGLTISAEILSHGRDKKVVVFKMKRRKGYQVKKGHRQNFTMVKIDKFKKQAKAKKTTKASSKDDTTKDSKVSSKAKATKTNSKEESK
ncbi:MAG: 50S ribosomal protein L21 [bacterium TMED161]|nr:50S ribosomal protein L21 [Candidatus Neomarinimicrobiota bacterium]OUW21306.1 MAG: 50S ribosomal protein L21 [bacterium TMED161]|tara:strand:- start:215 stop:640 length:426 start_codon:yes stop_codon:yes gene_type:complete